MISLINIESVFEIKAGPEISAVIAVNDDGAKGEGSSKPVELPLPWRELQKNPDIFSMLGWRCELSRFEGRNDALAALDEWANSPIKISAKVLSGQGGAGKSRLAAECARALRNSGWAAGFVDLRSRSRYLAHKIGALLIVDYPEEDLAATEEFLRDLAKIEHPQKIRVLFLSRNDFSFWRDVIVRCRAADIFTTSTMVLEPLQDAPAFALFMSALETAAEALGTVPLPLSESAFSEWLMLAPENKQALFIVAAAVHAAINPADEVVRYSGRQVIAALVQREVIRLRAVSSSNGLDENLVMVILCVATFAGVLGAEGISAVLKTFKGTEKDDDVLRAVGSLGYVKSGSIVAPSPDLVAARLVYEAIKVLPASTASGLVWVGFEAAAKAADGGSWATALRRFARVGHDLEFTLKELDPRLDNLLAAAIASVPARAVDLISQFVHRTLPITLGATDVAVWRALAKLAPDDTVRSKHLNNLAAALISKEEFSEASAVLELAIALDAKLMSIFGPFWAGELAIKYQNLARLLRLSGNANAAVQAARKGEKLFRSSSDKSPKILENFAACLHALARYASEDRKIFLARKYITEAKGILVTLISENHLEASELVPTQITYSSVEIQAGNWSAALGALQEAEKILREAETSAPGRYNDALAGVLNNQALILGQNMKEFDRAMAALQEAIPIMEYYSTINPATFLADLGAAYLNLASVHIGQNSFDKAGAAFRRALSVLFQTIDRFGASYDVVLDVLRGYLPSLKEDVLKKGGDERALFAHVDELAGGTLARRPDLAKKIQRIVADSLR